MISYLSNKGKIYIGRSNPIWGVGESKIFLSDKKLENSQKKII